MNFAYAEAPERIRARAKAVKEARRALAGVRAGRPVSVHRAMRSAPLRFGALLQACLIAALFVALLWNGRSALMDWWQSVILFWARPLGLPLWADPLASAAPAFLSPEGAWRMPTWPMWLVTAAVVVAAYASTYRMSDALTPVKFLVRTLCGVQITALVFFAVAPRSFAYTVPGHMQTMLNVGYGLMLAVSLLLALSYCVLRMPLRHKLIHPALVLAYFTLMVPHQVVLHALVLQHFTVLFMPMLYLCFGVVFDVMMFVALYSWLASGLPAEALS